MEMLLEKHSWRVGCFWIQRANTLIPGDIRWTFHHFAWLYFCLRFHRLLKSNLFCFCFFFKNITWLYVLPATNASETNTINKRFCLEGSKNIPHHTFSQTIQIHDDGGYSVICLQVSSTIVCTIFFRPNPNAYDLLDMVRAVVQCILSDILRNANIKTPISTSVYVAITMRK